MFEGEQSNRSWRSGSLTGIVSQKQRQQVQEQKQPQQQRLDEIHLGVEDETVEDETVGEFFHPHFRSKDNRTRFRSPLLKRSGREQIEVTSESGEDRGITGRRVDSPGQSAGGDAGKVGGGGGGGEGGGGGSGPFFSGNDLEKCFGEFKDAEEIDEDTELGKYVESRLYQNLSLRRYPSEFELPGEDKYDLETKGEAEEVKGKGRTERAGDNGFELHSEREDEFETPNWDDNGNHDNAKEMDGTDDGGAESVSDELREVEAGLSAVAIVEPTGEATKMITQREGRGLTEAPKAVDSPMVEMMTAKRKPVALNLAREREVISDAITRLRRVENRLMRGGSDPPTSLFTNRFASTSHPRLSASSSLRVPTWEEADEIIDRIQGMCGQLRTMLHQKTSKEANNDARKMIGADKTESGRTDVNPIGNANNNREKRLHDERREKPRRSDSIGAPMAATVHRKEVVREEREKERRSKEEEEEEEEWEEEIEISNSASEPKSLARRQIVRPAASTHSSPNRGVTRAADDQDDSPRRRSSWSGNRETTKMTTNAAALTADKVVEAWTMDYEAEGLFDYRRYSNLVVRENGKLKMVDEVEDEPMRKIPEHTVTRERGAQSLRQLKSAAESNASARVAKVVRPKLRWSAMTQETTADVEAEHRDALSPARMEEEEQQLEEETRERGKEAQEEKVEQALRGAGSTLRKVNETDIRGPNVESGRKDDNDDEEEDEEPRSPRTSPRTAKEEERRKDMARAKRHAKDFTFNTLKQFWDKVEEGAKKT